MSNVNQTLNDFYGISIPTKFIQIESSFFLNVMKGINMLTKKMSVDSSLKERLKFMNENYPNNEFWNWIKLSGNKLIKTMLANCSGHSKLYYSKIRYADYLLAEAKLTGNKENISKTIQYIFEYFLQKER